MKLVIGMLLAAVSVGTAAAAPPPAGDFFQNQALEGVALSPDGRLAIARAASEGKRKGLVLIDLATMKPKILARYQNGDIGSAFWLTDKRIAYTVLNLDRDGAWTPPGLYAIDVDGSRARAVTATVPNQRSFAEGEFGTGYPQGERDFIGPDMQNSEDVHVGAQNHYDEREHTRGTVNSRTGRITFHEGPARTFSWLFDDTGTVRLALVDEGDLHTLHRTDDGVRWRKVRSFKAGSDTAFSPRLYINQTLYVSSRNGEDRASIYRYDIDRGAVDGAPVITSPDYDISGRFVSAGPRLLGFRMFTDAEDTIWYDQDMKSIQQEVDALLPQTINRISRGVRSQSPYVLVYSHSPQQPGTSLIFNRDTKQLTSLGSALPSIVPAQMAMTGDLQRYKARDGLAIPVYVTLPNVALKKNLPTIILVGSYPWRRNGSWSFNPEVQFLASRGYAVIQPDPRGAAGFGAAFAKAGHQQWGLAMQDDLADGARWAIAQGIADPKRICIAGKVYGGYAAMMGLVKDPELFRCGISWGGIVDIGLMFKHEWKESPAFGYGNNIKALVGDPATSLAQFNAASPLLNAARIKNPVLLAYGAQDVEVPGKHGQLLFDAIKPGNPAAEFHLFDQKGQAPSLEANRVELWTKIEQFLERHIGTK